MKFRNVTKGFGCVSKFELVSCLAKQTMLAAKMPKPIMKRPNDLSSFLLLPIISFPIYP